jgi:hypothetical protein
LFVVVFIFVCSMLHYVYSIVNGTSDLTQDGNMLRDGDVVEYEEAWDDRKGKYMADNVTGGVREEDNSRGRSGGGGGRDRYDDRRGGDRYDDRRGGGRDYYDDRRGGRDRDRYDDRRY